MELTIEQALQQGVVAHQGGKLKEAERLYRAVLQLQPLHPEANHNLGVLVISFGKVEVALPFFKTALDVKPDVEQFWYSYINALIKGQHRERAEEIAKKGRHYGLSGPDIDLLDGKIAQKLGKLDDAEASLRRAITLKPEFAAAHNILGLVFKDLGRLKEAEESLRQAIALKSGFAETHNNLGVTLHEMGNLDDAEASFRQAIALQKAFIQAHRNLANILREQGRVEEAIESDRYAIFLGPIATKDTELQKSSDNSSFKKPSSLEYPEFYREGMGTENVGGFLRSLVHMLRPKKILEIGAGYTTPFLLEALVNNERVYDDGNLKSSYFENYIYEPRLVIVDNMSLGELKEKPGMNDIISSNYTDFIEGEFQGKSGLLREKYGNFDFVWFDCGTFIEYTKFIDEYWEMCSDYILFHFTYTDGNPNEIHKTILNNVPGNPFIFDIVEPHKSRQGSITLVRKT